MSNVGIVGAGIAGLHLALFLQQRGVSCTLYVDRSASEMRRSTLPSTTALLGSTQARDRMLGTNLWEDAPLCARLDLRFKGLPELSSRGKLDPPARFVDMRLYLPALLEEFEVRGGRVVRTGTLAPESLARLSDTHTLMVVASGRGELSNIFPRIASRSPWLVPQRALFAGLFHGVRAPEEEALLFQVIPGQGEIFESRLLGAEGVVTCILVEAVPQSTLDVLTRLRYDDDPAGFEARLLALLTEHAPSLRARIERDMFYLTNLRDHLQGAIVPTARRAYVELSEGRFAFAVGDTFATHDPVLWQGANTASRSAFALGDAIVERLEAGGPIDAAFCEEVDARLWSIVRPSMEWTNAFLTPPPPHAMALLGAASRQQEVADAFASNFDDPARQWEILRDPSSVTSFLETFARAA